MEIRMRLQNVSVSYDHKAVLSGVSLEIPSHRITAILGPSGCGKTTLLHAMNGLLREQPGAVLEGEITLSGQSTARMPREELRRRVGLVFQTPAPFPFSIWRNMTYAPRYYGVRDRKQLDAVVKEKLTMAGLYEEVRQDLGKSALKLSGGQQQRLCIARALTVEPEVLLLDEPCSALDVASSAAVEEMLVRLKTSCTIVIVTHNIPQAKRIADYAAFFCGGRLVEAGPADAFFSAPARQETRDFLGGAFG